MFCSGSYKYTVGGLGLRTEAAPCSLWLVLLSPLPVLMAAPQDQSLPNPSASALLLWDGHLGQVDAASLQTLPTDLPLLKRTQ